MREYAVERTLSKCGRTDSRKDAEKTEPDDLDDEANEEDRFCLAERVWIVGREERATGALHDD